MWYQASKKIIIAGKKEVVQILNNDLELYKYVEKLLPKTQSPAAYFLRNGIEPDQVEKYFIKLDRVDKVFPYNIQYTKNGVLFNGKLYNSDNWIPFTETVDGLYTAVSEKLKTKEQKQQHSLIQKFKDRSLPYQNGKINVVKINNVQDAIKYGKGMSWCIAQPANHMWQTYRDNQNSTFYFVFDGTRSENDPLRRVAVDASKRGLQLTDVKNTTGVIAEFGKDVNKYMEYLQAHGVDISQFKNDPPTEQEEREKVLQKNIYNLQDFINLPQTYPDIENVYSKYIGRGHSLKNEQLQWLIDHKLNHLVEQYISTGLDQVELQKAQLQHNNQWMRTYNRMIDIKADTYIKGIKENPDQIDWVFETLGEADTIKRMVEKGLDANIVVNFYAEMESGDSYSGHAYEKRVTRENDPIEGNTELIKFLALKGGDLGDLIDFSPIKDTATTIEYLYNNGIDVSSITHRVRDTSLLKKISYNTKNQNLIRRLLSDLTTYNDPDWVKNLLLNLTDSSYIKYMLQRVDLNYEMEEDGQKITLGQFLEKHNLMPKKETINPAAWQAEYGVTPKPFNLEKQEQQKKEDFMAEHGVDKEKDVV